MRTNGNGYEKEVSKGNAFFATNLLSSKNVSRLKNHNVHDVVISGWNVRTERADRILELQ